MSELIFPEDMSHEDRMKYYFKGTRAMGGKPSKKQSPANKLTDDIIKYVASIGGAGRRVNVMGIFNPATGKWRKSGMKKGFEDVDAVVPVMINGFKVGVKFGYEVKIGKDTMKEEQEDRKIELESSGGVYIISKTISQVIQDTQDALRKIRLGTNQAI